MRPRCGVVCGKSAPTCRSLCSSRLRISLRSCITDCSSTRRNMPDGDTCRLGRLAVAARGHQAGQLIESLRVRRTGHARHHDRRPAGWVPEGAGGAVSGGQRDLVFCHWQPVACSIGRHATVCVWQHVACSDSRHAMVCIWQPGACSVNGHLGLVSGLGWLKVQTRWSLGGRPNFGYGHPRLPDTCVAGAAACIQLGGACRRVVLLSRQPDARSN